MRFSKYHGTGNDFVMVEDLDGVARPLAGVVAAVCDRHLGVGADGLIRIVRGDARGRPGRGLLHGLLQRRRPARGDVRQRHPLPGQVRLRPRAHRRDRARRRHPRRVEAAVAWTSTRRPARCGPSRWTWATPDARAGQGADDGRRARRAVRAGAVRRGRPDVDGVGRLHGQPPPGAVPRGRRRPRGDGRGRHRAHDRAPPGLPEPHQRRVRRGARRVRASGSASGSAASARRWPAGPARARRWSPPRWAGSPGARRRSRSPAACCRWSGATTTGCS